MVPDDKIIKLGRYVD